MQSVATKKAAHYQPNIRVLISKNSPYAKSYLSAEEAHGEMRPSAAAIIQSTRRPRIHPSSETLRGVSPHPSPPPQKKISSGVRHERCREEEEEGAMKDYSICS
ncbi:hypothetical protein Salat_2209900 [Sesamum alatum]|uniref:Uncharacterized protein n=1 Tax=Sesamum alatum TaxID=300844 RepID=A0AAE1XUR0_9LAMI|nr:hypothetical protein Salat_2209900 [Sesamum alatum]